MPIAMYLRGVGRYDDDDDVDIYIYEYEHVQTCGVQATSSTYIIGLCGMFRVGLLSVGAAFNTISLNARPLGSVPTWLCTYL